MTETITTKPGDKYRSIKNPRVYEALRREGHDKASAARISNAQAKRRVVRRKSYTVADLEVAALKDHDPLRAVAIAAQLPQAALKGEQLAPGVTRIHGDLCNVHGRWGSCSGAGHSDSKRVPFKALPKVPKPKGGKRASGRKGRVARAAAKPKKAAQTDAQRQQEQLAREARSEQRYQAHHAQSRAEREADQKKREAGQLSRDVARQQERMRREMERQAKPAKGGGGGKGKQPRQPIASRMAQIANRPVKPAVGGSGAKPAKPAMQKPQIAQELLDAVQMLSDGKPIDQATEDLLVRNGLARRVKGQLVLSATGLRAIRTSQKSFAVFKDASGRWRWLSRTTTAFEDRDKEVISTESLADDVQRADENGKYGPLRWWHMGRPDPLNVDAPWGLGVDLGWCDFNAMSGKTLIESGTFKSGVIARAVAARADELELSPGFFHAIGEPDAAGVFHRIRRFERSLVPTWAGRASNYYTGLIVQEKAMDQKKIEALKMLGLDETTLKALIGDVERAEKTAESAGVRYKEQPVDLLRALLTGEQPAQEAAPTADLPADPLAALKEELVALRAEFATLKAPPTAPVDAEDDPAQGGDAGADEAVEGEPPIDESSDGGLTLSTDDLAAIGQVIGGVLQSALEPLISAMGITQKLEGHLGELKTMMGGYVKQKDDSEAAQANEVATLKASIEQQQAKLAELLGEQPRTGYRPTQATDNSPWTDPQVLAAIKDVAAGNGFEDLTSKLFPGILPPN